MDKVQLSGPVLEAGTFRDALLTFGAAGTVAAGTILAIKQVEDAVTVAADAGNTGDGTVTAATVAAGEIIPNAGAYVLECIEAVANGGVFNLSDPDGNVVAGYLAMAAGAGAATEMQAAGLAFTVTDGGADFVAGDKFTLTVAADGNRVPFATDGAGGAQVPASVATYDVTAAAAGDVAIREMSSGKVRKEALIIDADGDGSNVTAGILDQLRDVGILAESVSELNIYDNQ